MTLLIIFWLGVGILCGVIGASKGRSGFGWFLLGICFSLFALVAIIAMPPLISTGQPGSMRSNKGLTAVFVLLAILAIIYQAGQRGKNDTPPYWSVSERVGTSDKSQQVTTVVGATAPAPVTKTSVAPPVTRWEVSSETSSIDDSTNVSATAIADAQVHDKFGRANTVTARIDCRENSTNFYFNFDDLFMADSGGFGTVTLRADKEPARKIEMTESTNHKALGLWNGSGVPMLKYLVGKKTLLLVATPFSESSVETTFDMSGYDAALNEVRKACHW